MRIQGYEQYGASPRQTAKRAQNIPCDRLGKSLIRERAIDDNKYLVIVMMRREMAAGNLLMLPEKVLIGHKAIPSAIKTFVDVSIRAEF